MATVYPCGTPPPRLCCHSDTYATEKIKLKMQAGRAREVCAHISFRYWNMLDYREEMRLSFAYQYISFRYWNMLRYREKMLIFVL